MSEPTTRTGSPPGRGRALVAKRDIAGSGLDDEYVMLDPGPGVYYGLNAVGTVVWHFLQEPRRLDEIAVRVCAEFDVTPERCAADLQPLIDDMVARGLVEFVDVTPPSCSPTDAG